MLRSNEKAPPFGRAVHRTRVPIYIFCADFLAASRCGASPRRQAIGEGCAGECDVERDGACSALVCGWHVLGDAEASGGLGVADAEVQAPCGPVGGGHWMRATVTSTTLTVSPVSREMSSRPTLRR